MKYKINFEAAAGTNKAILESCRESRAYENGVAGAPDGMRYDIICFANGFEKISVKVAGSTTAPISAEELEKRNAAGDFVYCNFEDFAGNIYQNYSDKSVRISASAKKITILNPANGGK